MLIELYNLANDHERIRRAQRATLNTKDYGLMPENGLFGSGEWWQAIRTGKLPTVQVEGVISRVYMGSMNDWPEFEIDSNGTKSSWARTVHRREDDKFYIPGKRVCLEYVIQHAKKDLGNLGTTAQEVVLRIAVEQ